MRASDTDRDRVAEQLREAVAEGRIDRDEFDGRLDLVYRAKTYAELEPITADLPTGERAPAPAAPAAAARPDRFGGVPSGTVAVAIMGGFSRKGSWVVPKVMTAVAVMGGGEIDLREARFSQRTVTIHVVTIMGGIGIIVPEDAHVEVNGIGIMGGFDDRAAGEGAVGGPRIVINGFAFWGGVGIQRKALKKPRKSQGSTGQGELNA